jgi:hypothetical protein
LKDKPKVEFATVENESVVAVVAFTIVDIIVGDVVGDSVVDVEFKNVVVALTIVDVETDGGVVD